MTKRDLMNRVIGAQQELIDSLLGTLTRSGCAFPHEVSFAMLEVQSLVEKLGESEQPIDLTENLITNTYEVEK